MRGRVDWWSRTVARQRTFAAVQVIGWGVVVVGLVAPIVRDVLDPPIDDLPERADAVVVFAGEPARTRIALGLMEQGVADVLVVSRGASDRLVAEWCGRSVPYEVVCPEPDPANTAGEARMFGELAATRGWRSLVAVTANFHSPRARLWLERCYDGDVVFAVVDWARQPTRRIVKEVAGILAARFVDRAC